MARANYTVTDYSFEKSTAGFTGVATTAANYDAQQTAFSALRTAVNGIILGEPQKYQYIAVDFVNGNDRADSPYAQRENKWLVSYVGDTSGKLYQLEIPTADLADGHLVVGSDLADLTNADIAAFVTAFESFQRAPDALTETVTVTQIRFVGRNI